jgi:single-strand DNA-binding protein
MSLQEFSITGTVHHVGDVQTRGAKGFQVQQLVLAIADGEYEQMVAFDVTGKKVEILRGVSVGMDATVHFDLRGREWQGKFFTNLHAWKVEVKSPASATAPLPQPTPESEDKDMEVPF